MEKYGDLNNTLKDRNCWENREFPLPCLWIYWLMEKNVWFHHILFSNIKFHEIFLPGKLYSPYIAESSLHAIIFFYETSKYPCPSLLWDQLWSYVFSAFNSRPFSSSFFQYNWMKRPRAINSICYLLLSSLCYDIVMAVIRHFMSAVMPEVATDLLLVVGIFDESFDEE